MLIQIKNRKPISSNSQHVVIIYKFTHRSYWLTKINATNHVREPAPYFRGWEYQMLAKPMVVFSSFQSTTSKKEWRKGEIFRMRVSVWNACRELNASGTWLTYFPVSTFPHDRFTLCTTNSACPPRTRLDFLHVVLGAFPRHGIIAPL